MISALMASSRVPVNPETSVTKNGPCSGISSGDRCSSPSPSPEGEEAERSMPDSLAIAHARPGETLPRTAPNCEGGRIPQGEPPHSRKIAQRASSGRERRKAPRPAASKAQQHKAAKTAAKGVPHAATLFPRYHGGPPGSVRGLSHACGRRAASLALTTAVPRKKGKSLRCTQTCSTYVM